MNARGSAASTPRDARAPDLVADGFSVSIRDRFILTSASLRLWTGELRFLLGRNGSGKSTLLGSIIGARSRLSGRLTIDGRTLERWTPTVLADRGLWWWPQHGFLSRGLSIAEHLALLARRVRDAEPAFDQALERLGAAPDLARREVAGFSPGERKVVEAAFVVASRARFVLADEPCAGLSPAISTALLEEFGRLARGGVAVCCSTHDIWIMRSFASTVTWLTSGTTHEFRSFDDAQDHWNFRTDFLGQR